MPAEALIGTVEAAVALESEPPLIANPQPRRRFPWGDQADAERASYDDTGIGSTSAVGCFAGGASPCGCEELGGNVWEWTRSLWGENSEEPDFQYPYNPDDGRENLEASNDVLRVLRGGSFDFSMRRVRCAYRGWSYPNLFGWSYGFRVVVSPGSPPDSTSEL